VRQGAVSRPHACGEAIDRVVGQLGDAVEIVVIEGFDHQDGHRRCGPQRLMDANKIVVHPEQRDMRVVLNLL
jgi:hypothetical protein